MAYMIIIIIMIIIKRYNRNQFDLSISNVKSDDWSNYAFLKKVIVNIRKT